MQGRSILVVEEERVTADAVTARLRKEGFGVETPLTGRAASTSAARCGPKRWCST